MHRVPAAWEAAGQKSCYHDNRNGIGSGINPLAVTRMAVTMARMVDIGAKPDVERRATATGEIGLKASTITAIRTGKVEKGDPIHTAEVAGIQAIKRTSEALPHCHPIPLTRAAVHLEVLDHGVRCTTEVAATYKTGVEMEALHGCAVALLTVWDMVKSLEKDGKGQYPFTAIRDLKVTAKEKG